MSILLTILFNLIIFFNVNFIIKKYGLYDHPDMLRKIHKKKTSLAGGFIFFLNIIFIFFCYSFQDNYFENLIKNFFNNNYINLFLFLFFLIIVFVFGFFDDKFNISANKKLFFLFAFFFLLVNLDPGLIISRINFSFTKNIFYLKQFEFFFTILCLLLFINAFNMFDGINLQSGLYSIYIFTIFFFYSENYFFLIILIPLFMFLYFNLKSQIFLGNSGSYLIGFLISYFTIKIFNNFNNIFSDDIFLLMIMPGFDMLRLFVVRLFNKKNPFAPDNNHFHHLLILKYNFVYALIINLLLTILPFIIGFFVPSYIAFGFFLTIYFSFLISFKKNDQK
jgi:UDP-GlcNAc:undecaprenyl-phosphate GlcNAc-1-phosphate transferase